MFGGDDVGRVFEGEDPHKGPLGDGQELRMGVFDGVDGFESAQDRGGENDDIQEVVKDLIASGVRYVQGPEEPEWPGDFGQRVDNWEMGMGAIGVRHKKEPGFG